PYVHARRCIFVGQACQNYFSSPTRPSSDLDLVRPFKITRPNFRAESVLELPSHSIFRSRTEVGDQLVIEDAMRGKLQHAFRAKIDRKSTRLNSSHHVISYAIFCSKTKSAVT